VIGRFKLLQKVGEGGMGVVYMAEQTEPVKRKVALKIIKLGMDTKQVIARFEAERQALALMDHPNIAKVLDGGATDTGRPYFVMELVRGVPITEYCDKNRLSTQQRLELFIPVCQAIQHAHQKSVIHRDIKPSNVMVTLNDGVPHPMVIDFGIAKATNQKLTEKTLFTNYAQLIGTPAYMSPEQAEMSKLDVDTRTDVYSLGVLLYELLTGTTPFPSKELLSMGYGEMQKVITEKEPPKPSTRLSTMENEERTVVATNRSMQVSALGKAFQGDLDWIVMKALEKDRTHRYETVNGLLSDIKRHLDNESVSAAAPTFRYQLSKFARRNKRYMRVAASVAALLVLAVLFSSYQAVRATRARLAADIARLEAEKSYAKARDAQASESRLRQSEADQRKRAEARELEARRFAYASDMLLAQERIANNDRGGASRLLQTYIPKLAEPDLRGWEWHFLSTKIQGPELAVLRGHDHRVTDVAYSPDGKWIASAGLDRIVNIWDAQSHAPVRRLAFEDVLGAGIDPYSIAFSPDGKFLAGAASQPSKVVLWEVHSWNVSRVLTNEHRADALAFSPDGRFLAICGQRGGNGIVVWDFGALRPISSWRLPEGQASFPVALAFSADSKTLVYDAKDGNLGRWSTETHQMLSSIPVGSPNDMVQRAVFTADGLFAAAGTDSNLLRLWALPEWRLIYQLTNRRLLALSDREDVLIATDAQDVYYHQLSTGKLSGILKGHDETLNAAAISPDGKTVVTCANDGTVRLWPATVLPESPSEVILRTNTVPDAFVLKPHISADQRLAFSLFTNGVLSIWDTGRTELLGTHHSPIPDLETVEVAPGGQLAAFGGESNGLALVNLVNHQVVERRFLTNSVSLVRFSRDGSLLAIRYANPIHLGWFGSLNHLQVFENQTMKFLREFPLEGGNPFAVEFSRDNRYLAYAMWDPPILVGDMETGQTVPLRGQKGLITALAMTPDARLIATTSEEGDGTATLWDGRTGQKIHAFRGTWEQYGSVALLEDGSRLAAGAGGVDIWDLATFRLVQTIPVTNQWIAALSWADHGRRLIGMGATSLFTWKADSYLTASLGTNSTTDVHRSATDLEDAALRLLRNTPAPELARRIREMPGLPDRFWRRMSALDLLWKGDLKGAIEAYPQFAIPDRDPRCTPHQIDLSNIYSRLLVPDGIGDGYDLASFPSGFVTFDGIAFDVRGVVELGHNSSSILPSRARVDAINQTATRLHFLQANSYQLPDGAALGRYVLEYENGTTADLPLKYGEDVRDWWTASGESTNTPNAHVIWRGYCPAAKTAGIANRVWERTYENPHPKLKIRALEFVSDRRGAGPMILAVTLE
jgi:serine/threonine protein kinase/WD40 repeat protein